MLVKQVLKLNGEKPENLLNAEKFHKLFSILPHLHLRKRPCHQSGAFFLFTKTAGNSREIPRESFCELDRKRRKEKIA